MYRFGGDLAVLVVEPDGAVVNVTPSEARERIERLKKRDESN